MSLARWGSQSLDPPYLPRNSESNEKIEGRLRHVLKAQIRGKD